MSQYPEPPGPPGPYSREHESQYPPPPGEEDDRPVRAYHHQRVPSAGNGHMPSPYRQEHQYPPPPPPPQHNGYSVDPRMDPRAYSRDQYPPPPTPYREERGYPQEYSRGGQHQQQQQHQQQPPQHAPFAQSAPRQRTAIACRYCRRRKIRCSGFDQNPEGRCSNCQRFQQECIFTPVSSQAQAFVPAHAVYPHMRGMQVGPDGRARQSYQGQQQAQIYGAHGQPLGPLPPSQQPIQQHPQQAPSPYNDYAIASPTGSYSSYTDENQTSRKRPAENPLQQILPPPLPGQQYARQENGNRRPPAEMQAQDERDSRYNHHLAPLTPTSQEYKPTASNYSPGSSTSSNGGLHPPQSHLPGMTRTPPPRSSPAGETSGNGRQDPMSLRSIVDNKRSDTDIDRTMLGRLGRKN